MSTEQVKADQIRRREDEGFMRRAIDLAKAGEGWVHPNPMVGAVIVKDGRIIGEGYHQRCGQLHAERNAIASVRKRMGASAADAMKGATIYVTLEPCCHYGKTPPCTEAIIENEISRVVIGSRDPNPLVAGKGARILREAGIRVEEDFLREECDALNPVFFHYIETKMPYVIMKYAMTADGKIATRTGASKWITGDRARQEVQRLRHACMGICVGIGTVLADDPLLNCRLEDGAFEEVCHPVRVICDSRLRIPLESRICRTAGDYETILVCAGPPEAGEQEAEAANGKGWEHEREMGFGSAREHGPEREHGPAEEKRRMADKKDKLEKLGIEVLEVPSPDGHVDMGRLAGILGARGMDSILLEGGGELNDSALRAGIVNEVRAFIAPKIFGGTAKSPVQGTGVEVPDQAIPMRLVETRAFGEDLMLRYLL